MSGQGHIGSPFVRSLRGLSFFVGVAAAFTFMPKLYERTAPSVWRYTLEHYQGMDTQLVLLGLKGVLALVVYFTVSATINAALSAYGLHLALKVMQQDSEVIEDPSSLRRQRKSRRRMVFLGLIVVVGLIQWGLS
ncbi:hypothetical protein [Marinibacterium profundimaris]|uniref:Uncharacterized protein n=1 Tax=Marinibacterium profundimaris TaxID=1679460 RepID=A0A225NBG5_9RHOB|nr:hypothetical protein [Marinibacterium profundimaris]OWU67821.1 hypothetical protein ATO3_25675 [Marinibacterium profundimaris]